MTPTTLEVLLTSAATVALLHTVIGVDHYLPFIVIGKARNWPISKTLGLTAVCGVGHVTGSVAIGLVGVGLGVAFDAMAWIESARGSFAAWGLIGFGLLYTAISLVRLATGKTHSHAHSHVDGSEHLHEHDHRGNHAHPHRHRSGLMATWSLFILFVLGPCEALIPLFIVPAASRDWFAVGAITLVFSAVTIVAMLATVAVGVAGFSFVKIAPLEKYANTLAGVAIAASGLAIQLLGI